MRERCQNAAELLNRLGRNQIQLPFVLSPSTKSTLPLKADTKLASRSPLLMSDNNSQFLSQAKVTSCRDSVQSNPLRNITGPLFQLARNLGMDLPKMSHDVQQAMAEKEKQSDVPNISFLNVNQASRRGDRGTQTDQNPCAKCLLQEAKTFESKSCQARINTTLEATTQYEEEPGSFSVTLDARRLQMMTRDQQQTLADFCRAFGIYQDRFGERNTGTVPRWNREDEDDLSGFVNPENPNVGEGTFISFSPVREVSRSRSPRRRITERLGEKVDSPRYYLDDDILSPRSSNFASQIPIYRIPSPPIEFRRNISRERERLSPSRGYRNRSRSRSRSPLPRSFSRRSRSRSPQHPFSDRLGRY